MPSASNCFTDVQKEVIEQAVVAAEAETSCEIVPVVASASGRYDRPEDMVGLWFALLAAVAVWLALPRHAFEPGDWDAMPLCVEVLILAVTIVAAFFVGAFTASRIDWLRRLCMPRSQMQEEVARRAREVFFDKRVHHTAGGSGLLIYVSLFEQVAIVLGDSQIVEHPGLGHAFLDDVCRRLTERIREGDLTQAFHLAIDEAGERLAKSLPRMTGDANELHNALVVLD